MKISDRKEKPHNIQIKSGDLQGLTCSSVTADTFPIRPGPATAREFQFPECFARCPSPAALRPHRNSAMAFHSKNTLFTYNDFSTNNAHPKRRNIVMQHRLFLNSRYGPRPQTTETHLSLHGSLWVHRNVHLTWVCVCLLLKLKHGRKIVWLFLNKNSVLIISFFITLVKKVKFDLFWQVVVKNFEFLCVCVCVCVCAIYTSAGEVTLRAKTKFVFIDDDDDIVQGYSNLSREVHFPAV